jgi:phage baseplate assembly protein W
MSAISFKSVGETQDSEKFKSSRTFELPFGIKTPIRRGDGVLFEMSTDMRDQVHDNLKNLILTNAGERLGNYNFGADLQEILSEKLSKENFDDVAMKKIANSVKAFMPYIELVNFESDIGKIDEVTGVAATIITITYNVVSVGISNKKIGIELQPIS